MSSLFDIISALSPKSNKENPDSLSLDDQRKRLHNLRYSSDTSHRKWLAFWATGIVTSWLGLVLFILMSNNSKFCLSDTVLSVLLGTTTLNVLGISFIVLRGLFNSQTIPD